jgi:copper transport protein
VHREGPRSDVDAVAAARSGPTSLTIVRRALGFAFAALSVLAGPAAPVAFAHAELVVASPADGEVLDASPPEIRLVFSEPVEAGFSTIDLAGAAGIPILTAAGAPDPSDDHVLVAAVPALVDGSYTVTWRVLSKADGHAYVGTYAFAVATSGEAFPPGPIEPAGPGPTAGHQVALEAQGRIVLYGGLLLAFGLAVVAWLVLEPAMGAIPSAVGRAIGVALLVAGIGAAMMLLSSGLGLPGPTGRPDLVGYATSSRPGILLLARVVLALAGGVAVLALVSRGRIDPAIDVGALAATAALALTVAAGHAAVFEPPVTIAVWFVHAAAAGVWAAGLAVVAVLASRRPPDGELLRAVVIRYSALGLVGVGLVVLTGAYQAWLELGGPPSLDDPYARLVLVKVVVAAAAFGLGLLNYLDGGRLMSWLGGLGRRATVEAFLAAVVIVVTASLVAIPPPGPGRPVELAGTAGGGSPASVGLAIAPGRPGPSRFIALPEAGVVPATLRLEAADGSVVDEATFRPVDGDEPTATASFVTAVGDVRIGDWRAVVEAEDGVTAGTFPFTMTADGIAAGRAVPPVDLGLVLGIVMVFAGVLAFAFARAEGRLPRTDRVAARIALSGGGLAAAVVGLLVVAVGPSV